MPAKATIFNLKCESVFDFGTGPRNAAYFNAHGNSILLRTKIINKKQAKLL